MATLQQIVDAIKSGVEVVVPVLAVIIAYLAYKQSKQSIRIARESDKLSKNTHSVTDQHTQILQQEYESKQKQKEETEQAETEHIRLSILRIISIIKEEDTVPRGEGNRKMRVLTGATPERAMPRIRELLKELPPLVRIQLIQELADFESLEKSTKFHPLFYHTTLIDSTISALEDYNEHFYAD